jgi:flagellin
LTGISAKAQVTEKIFTVTTGAAGSAAATGQVNSNDLLINGVDIGGLSVAATGGDRTAQLVAAINAKTSQTGVKAEVGAETNKLKLTAADGRNITATVGGSATATLAGVSSSTTTAALTLTSLTGKSSMDVTGTSGGIGAVNFRSGAGSVTLTPNTITGQTVSSVDLSSQENSQKALSILDAAIDTVTNSRANLGAYQNRFEAAISNLENTSTNLQASRSRILDTDYAKETTNLAKSQIVQQAATAMLAQANQSSQSVLALLK